MKRRRSVGTAVAATVCVLIGMRTNGACPVPPTQSRISGAAMRSSRAKVDGPVVMFGYTGHEDASEVAVFFQEENFYYLTGHNEPGAAADPVAQGGEGQGGRWPQRNSLSAGARSRERNDGKGRRWARRSGHERKNRFRGSAIHSTSWQADLRSCREPTRISTRCSRPRRRTATRISRRGSMDAANWRRSAKLKDIAPAIFAMRASEVAQANWRCCKKRWTFPSTRIWTP